MERTFGTRMKELREEKDLTLQDIASSLGLARSTIQRYEKDAIASLKMPVVQGIAKTLGTSAEYLLGETQDPKSKQVNFDSFTYALFEETKELTQENKDKLLEMAKFFKQQQ